MNADRAGKPRRGPFFPAVSARRRGCGENRTNKEKTIAKSQVR